MANEGKGLRGLPGLNNISAEERQQFMLANEDKLRKYSRARDREKAAEIIYNNRQFINEFGEEAFEQYKANGYDYAARNELLREKDH